MLTSNQEPKEILESPFLVQFSAVLMRHRGHNGHNGQFKPFLWNCMDAVTLCGHYGQVKQLTLNQ